MASDEGEQLPNTSLWTLGQGATLWRALINAFLENFDTFVGIFNASTPHAGIGYEAPQGGEEPDGARKTFNTANSFVQGSSMVYLTGVQLVPGSGDDYQEAQSGSPAGEYNQIVIEAGRAAPETDSNLHWAYDKG